MWESTEGDFLAATDRRPRLELRRLDKKVNDLPVWDGAEG